MEETDVGLEVSTAIGIRLKYCKLGNRSHTDPFVSDPEKIYHPSSTSTSGANIPQC